MKILCLLPQEDRLRCVSAICKGWRALRRERELWRDITLSETTHSAAGLVAFFTGPRSPLPEPSCVRRLTLHGCDAWDVKTLKSVVAAATGATHVTLQGTHVTKACLQLLTKRTSDAAPLQSLRVGRAASPKDTLTAALDVLASAPALTELSLGGYVRVPGYYTGILLTPAWLDEAAIRCAKARGGGASMLHTLGAAELDESWNPSISWVALGRLGRTFPELERLSMDLVEGLEHMPQGGGPAWAPLPRLRELRVLHVGNHGRRNPDVLARVADAAPNLQRLLLLTHATLHPEARAALEQPQQLLPLLGRMPQLRELRLENVPPPAAPAADDPEVVSLPELRRIHLQGCGSHAAAAATALAAAAPRLESLSLVFGPDGPAGAGVAGLAALASPSLRELRLSHDFVHAYGPASWVRPYGGSDGPGALAREVRSLAARRACPGLRALAATLQTKSAEALFDAAHPWPTLTALHLDGDMEATALASLSALKAPELTSLSLPGIARGVARRDAPRALVVAYEKLRADGRAPKLPPLRHEDGDDGSGAGPAPAE